MISVIWGALEFNFSEWCQTGSEGGGTLGSSSAIRAGEADLDSDCEI